MNFSVRCSICEHYKLMNPVNFKKNLIKYNCQDYKELGEKYICRSCFVPIRKKQRAINRKNRKLNDNLCKNEFTRLGRFIYCRVSIQIEVNKFKNAGMHNEMARNVFMSAVKNILDNAGFLEYHFVIDNGNLKGIMLKRVPLYGEVLMELKG